MDEEEAKKKIDWFEIIVVALAAIIVSLLTLHWMGFIAQ
jgi:hypothetical protein